MPLRVALPNASEIGRSFAAPPDRFSLRGIAGICTAIAVLWLNGSGAALDGSGTTSLLCLGLLVFGLPHGSLDLALIRRRAQLGSWQVVTTVFVYLGFAAATYAMWKIAPVWALAGFLVIASVHFAEDWADRLPIFFSIGIAVALLTVPALLHYRAIAGIFVQLTGQGSATILADIAVLLAPVALVATGVGLQLMIRDGHSVRALETGTVIVGMMLLPPIVGFAIFFCLVHSPRHFAAARAELGGRDGEAALVTCAALGIAALIYTTRGAVQLEDGAIFASFVTLSVLTVPHMIVPRIMNRQQGRASD